MAVLYPSHQPDKFCEKAPRESKPNFSSSDLKEFQAISRWFIIPDMVNLSKTLRKSFSA